MTGTTNKGFNLPTNGSNVDDWDVVVNQNTSWMDSAFGGTTALNAVGQTGVVALTQAQYIPPFVTITGALTSNVNYQLPSGVGGEWSVNNQTSGAFTITWSSAGAGTSVVLPQGKRTVVQSDGTNIVTGPAASGANADITSLSGLTTALSVSQGGTGAATLTGVLKGNGTGAFTPATAGTDFLSPGAAATITAQQSLLGTTSNVAELLANAAEVVTVSATAATGTIAYYISSQSVLYFTTNASANWTVNLSFAVGHTLDSVLSTGQAITCTFLVSQGATPFYNTTVQVDGTTSGVTTKWLNGAPSGGNASGIDVYTYAIIKTGSAAFTVLASQAAFR